MHNNYYFLRQLSASLEKILTGSVISECFSQNKEELIVRFETSTGTFYIKGSVHPSFSCLSFPDTFHRARKNSVDLFEKLIGLRVNGIRQFKNERSFSLELSGSYALLFKMHGNRANIILFEKDNVSERFRNNLEADTALKLSSLDREINWSFENFQLHHDKPQAVYFTFGKIVWQYLDTLNFQSGSLRQKWELLQEVRAQLENPVFYITETDRTIVLSLLKLGAIRKTWTDPIAASNDFFYTYTRTFEQNVKKNTTLSALKARLQSSKNFFRKNADKLNELKQNNNYKTWADLIMANLHAIEPNAERITVPDFYNNGLPVEIRLKKEFTPQKNAEVYYRKSKNQHVEADRLEQVLKAKETGIIDLEEKIRSLESSDDQEVIKKIQSELDAEPKAGKHPAPLPYHEFIENGFKIWVGKNAQSNDILTLKFGYKEDLWLHAKDVAGSHVLIKYQAGKKFPKNVIERAAQLAAYNSKRKNETLCPVITTPRKYVRKRKGDPPGAVVIEREEVIMVEPKL